MTGPTLRDAAEAAWDEQAAMPAGPAPEPPFHAHTEGVRGGLTHPPTGDDIACFRGMA